MSKIDPETLRFNDPLLVGRTVQYAEREATIVSIREGRFSILFDLRYECKRGTAMRCVFDTRNLIHNPISYYLKDCHA
jgi:hypothetical protein